jgi:hypothetical protein
MCSPQHAAIARTAKDKSGGKVTELKIAKSNKMSKSIPLELKSGKWNQEPVVAESGTDRQGE